MGRKVRDRETGKLVKEEIPTWIELGIRLANFTPKRLHRALNDNITKACAKKFNDPKKAKKQIRDFVKRYKGQINLDEIKVPKHGFRTLNEFFTRALKPGVRPITEQDNPALMVSPADCRLSAFQCQSRSQRVWIKGHEFDYARMLDSEKRAAYYEGGAIVIARLAPQDYHRYHFPIGGRIDCVHKIQGHYYSVNPLVVHDRRVNVFTRNRRDVLYLKTQCFGTVAVVIVGATCVGSIKLYRTKGEVRKGNMMGNFGYGGSTLVILIPRNKIVLDQDLLDTSEQGRETYIKIGDRIGVQARRKKPSLKK